MKKILITTGGTGGHVIPAKIIEEHLKNDFEIYYSTDLRGLKYLSSSINKTKVIDTPKLNLSFYLPLKLTKLLYLIFQSILFQLSYQRNKKSKYSFSSRRSVPGHITKASSAFK